MLRRPRPSSTRQKLRHIGGVSASSAALKPRLLRLPNLSRYVVSSYAGGKKKKKKTKKKKKLMKVSISGFFFFATAAAAEQAAAAKGI
jgi:hypothetical protein